VAFVSLCEIQRLARSRPYASNLTPVPGCYNGLTRILGLGQVNTHEDFSRKEDIRGPSDRSFGWVFVIAFILIGAAPAIHGKPIRGWALATGVVILLVTLARPALLHPANMAWMRLGLLLSRIVNPIVTALLFYLVFTPVGYLMRRLGRDSIGARFDPSAGSYWIERKPPGPKPESMSQQF